MSTNEPKPGKLLKAHRDAVRTTRVSPAIGFGGSFAVAMGLFAWAGIELDARTGRSPLFVLIGLFLGLFYGAYEVWKLVRTTEDDDHADPDA